MQSNRNEIGFQGQFPLRELNRAIEALIDFRDAFDGHGEPLEDDDPLEPNGDDLGDPAWPEWHQRGRHKESFLPNFGRRDSEDAEDDEGGGDTEMTEDEPGFGPTDRRIASRFSDGPGCKISDPDYGAEEAGELEDGA